MSQARAATPNLTPTAAAYDQCVRTLAAHRVGSSDWKSAFKALKSASKQMTSSDRMSLRRRGAYQLRCRALDQAKVLEEEGNVEDAERLEAFASQIDVERGEFPTVPAGRRAPLIDTLSLGDCTP